MAQQRFYPYTPLPNEIEFCHAGGCEFEASWFDERYQAFWCDFHAAAEQANAVRVMCVGCLEWYNPTQLVESFCSMCRAAGSLLWSDEEVTQ